MNIVSAALRMGCCSGSRKAQKAKRAASTSACNNVPFFLAASIRMRAHPSCVEGVLNHRVEESCPQGHSCDGRVCVRIVLGDPVPS